MAQIVGDGMSRSVAVSGQMLSPGESLRLCNHSPDGFNWGYGGSGPAQLALAILLTHTDTDTALRLHQDFKWEFVSRWPKDQDFKAEVDIEEWLERKAGAR